MKNKNLCRGLIIASAAGALLAAAAAIAGALLLGAAGSRSSADTGYGLFQESIGQFGVFLYKSSGAARDVIFLTDQNELDSARAELDDCTQRTAEALESMKRYCSSPEQAALITTMETALSQYEEFKNEAAALSAQGKREEALKLLRAQALPQLDECVRASEELGSRVSTMKIESSADAAVQNSAGRTVCLIIAAAALMISVLPGVFLYRIVSRTD